MLIAGLIGLSVSLIQGIEATSNFAISFAIAYAWVAIFLVRIPFNLKRIEVDDSGLRVLSKNQSESISFRDIVSVSYFDFANPWMVTVRYHDSASHESKMFSYMPNAAYGKFLKPDEMTQFIIEEAERQNPQYQASNPVKNLGILFLAGLPVFGAMLYFMAKSEAFGLY